MSFHFHRIAGQFYNRPLLLLPAAADTISNVLLARIGDGSPNLGGRGGGGEDTAQTATTLFPTQVGGDGTMTVHTPQASRFYGEVPLSEDGSRRPLPFRRTAEGVAIITLVGEWVNRGGYVGASSGVISYEGFKYQVESAARDPRTRAILLDMESPGGEAVGAFEAAAAVRAAARAKPVWTLVNGLAASAAYAIASASTRVVSIPTGISGSIGVVLAHFDYSEMLAKEGIKPTFIHAGARKVDANPYQALPEAVRERLQGEVGQFYDLFVETVAAGRPGLTDKAIRGTEAGTFMGAEALELGLIDALGTFEEVLGELSTNGAAGVRITQGNTTTMSAAHTATSMAALAAAGALATVPAAAPGAAATAPAAALPAPAAAAPVVTVAATAGPEMVGMPKAEHDAALAAEHEKGRKAGAEAERARIGAILNHTAAAGRGKLAAHLAFKTEMGVDAAAEMLAASATEGAPDAAAFVAGKEAQAGLSLDPDAGAAGGGSQADAGFSWDEIVAGLNGSLPTAGTLQPAAR